MDVRLFLVLLRASAKFEGSNDGSRLRFPPIPCAPLLAAVQRTTFWRETHARPTRRDGRSPGDTRVTQQPTRWRLNLRNWRGSPNARSARDRENRAT